MRYWCKRILAGDTSEYAALKHAKHACYFYEQQNEHKLKYPKKIPPPKRPVGRPRKLWHNEPTPRPLKIPTVHLSTVVLEPTVWVPPTSLDWS